MEGGDQGGGDIPPNEQQEFQEAVEADCKLFEIASGLGSLDAKKRITKKTNYFVSKITSVYILSCSVS